VVKDSPKPMMLSIVTAGAAHPLMVTTLMQANMEVPTRASDSSLCDGFGSALGLHVICDSHNVDLARCRMSTVSCVVVTPSAKMESNFSSGGYICESLSSVSHLPIATRSTQGRIEEAHYDYEPQLEGRSLAC
jgi:hypothetical protein